MRKALFSDLFGLFLLLTEIASFVVHFCNKFLTILLCFHKYFIVSNSKSVEGKAYTGNCTVFQHPHSETPMAIFFHKSLTKNAFKLNKNGFMLTANWELTMNRSRKEMKNNFLPIRPNSCLAMIHQKHFTLNAFLLIDLLINWISPNDDA